MKEWNGIADNELKIGQVLTVVAPVAVTAPVIAPAVTVATPEAAIKVSESVSGTDEIKENGLAGLIDGADSNRKYLAQHRTIKPGTILKIRNLTTNQEVFVRVTGPIPSADVTIVILVSKSAYDRLGATDPTFRAEITYYK